MMHSQLYFLPHGGVETLRRYVSGNPAYHLVHRFTHRVVRGSLLICGRPDGRLSALTTLEQSVCLSVNQASSIQNFGVTCESITVGHNAAKLPLTVRSHERVKQTFNLYNSKNIRFIHQ